MMNSGDLERINNIGIIENAYFVTRKNILQMERKGEIKMKTVKKGKEIRRVNDKAAVKMVTAEGWVYCPKEEYKVKVKNYTDEAKAEDLKEK